MIGLIGSAIASMLADEGLDLVKGAIEGTKDKAISFIKEETGIDIATAEKLSPAEVAKLKEFEAGNKLELEKLALAHKVEDNRHEEKTAQSKYDDTADAREANVAIQTSEHSSDLSKVGAYYIDFAIIATILIIAVALLFLAIPAANVQLINIVFGALLAYGSTILGFHRGSSQGSKDKGTK